MTITHHAGPVRCIKFSHESRYFVSCDADGTILHYERTKKDKDNFPYRLLYKIQDRNEEILAIDSNPTLDMYVTLSRDGTVSLRCQRTSRLWHQFKLFWDNTQKNSANQKVAGTGTGFQKIFKKLIALKLSLHGYIVVVGQTDKEKPNLRFLIYNLSGDVLLRD